MVPAACVSIVTKIPKRVPFDAGIEISKCVQFYFHVDLYALNLQISKSATYDYRFIRFRRLLLTGNMSSAPYVSVLKVRAASVNAVYTRDIMAKGPQTFPVPCAAELRQPRRRRNVPSYIE